MTECPRLGSHWETTPPSGFTVCLFCLPARRSVYLQGYKGGSSPPHTPLNIYSICGFFTEPWTVTGFFFTA